MSVWLSVVSWRGRVYEVQNGVLLSYDCSTRRSTKTWAANSSSRSRSKVWWNSFRTDWYGTALGKVWNGDPIRRAACLDGDDSAYAPRLASSKQQTNTMSYWLTDIFFKVEVINHIFNYSDKRLPGRVQSIRGRLDAEGWRCETVQGRSCGYIHIYGSMESPLLWVWKLAAREDKGERRLISWELITFD